MLAKILLITITICNAVYGQELFNIDKEMCCNQKIIPNPTNPDVIPACCGDSSFDIRQELCCQNVTVKLPPEAFAEIAASTTPIPLDSPRRFGMAFLNFPHYACCGQTSFNYDMDVCCDDKIMPKPKTKDGSVDESVLWSCCGGELLNVTSQECCRNKIMDKASVTDACCGDKLIDSSTHMCCFEDFFNSTEEPVVLSRDGPDVGCCGRNRIDYKSEICCMNKVVKLPEDGALRMTSVCCGDKLWVAAPDEICCGGEVIKQSGTESCCDTTKFNWDTQICCGTTIHSRTTNSTFCCGETTYDERKDEACCYNLGKVVSIVDPEKRFCCE